MADALDSSSHLHAIPAAPSLQGRPVPIALLLPPPLVGLQPEEAGQAWLGDFIEPPALQHHQLVSEPLGGDAPPNGDLGIRVFWGGSGPCMRFNFARSCICQCFGSFPGPAWEVRGRPRVQSGVKVALQRFVFADFGGYWGGEFVHQKECWGSLVLILP